MIIDTIRNLDRYRAVSPNLRDAIAYLRTHDLQALPVGSFAIAGERIKAIVVDRPLETPPDFWESHVKYIDIHAVVRGTEIIRCFSDDSAYTADMFDAEGDAYLYYKQLEGSDLFIASGEAAILFPGEVHQTNLPNTVGEHVKKVILKVMA